MPIPMIGLIAGLAGLGAGLGYLATREEMKAYKSALDELSKLQSPVGNLIEEIKKYGIKQALEKYGYSEIRNLLDTVYRSQISSILARTGRQLALTGAQRGVNQMALLGRLREPVDIAYLQQVANLPFDMLKMMTGLLSEYKQQEFNIASARAGIRLQRPSYAQNILAGLLGIASLGLTGYRGYKELTTPTYVYNPDKKVYEPK